MVCKIEKAKQIPETSKVSFRQKKYGTMGVTFQCTIKKDKQLKSKIKGFSVDCAER